MAIHEFSTSVRFFGASQALVLLAILVGILVHRKRLKDRDKNTGPTISDRNPRDAIKRSPVYQSPTENRGTEASSERSTPLELESSLPLWTKNTPAHEILGIHPEASRSEIEAAFKRLLKKYHPDRVAHWGPGYQKRAHHLVLMIQDAKEKMLRR